RVGRKAGVLGWAEANGLATPGGVVVPAERFWAALEACGAVEQARYLERSGLRLDPHHTLDLAASIVDGMGSSAVDALAASDAEVAFGLVAGPRLVCRSSAAMEDGRSAAFPGVYLSVLNLDSIAGLGAAIVACWRSVFSPDTVRYLLRMAAEPLDLSMAVLVQTQVETAWYGVYASVDPVTGAPGPVADLSHLGPDALVNGSRATVRARREDGRWTGAGVDHGLGTSLDAVRRAALRLADHLQSEVDLEFAFPAAGGDPVILQCRPLTRAFSARTDRQAIDSRPGPIAGRGCAGGQAVGLATEPDVPPDDGESRIAVVKQLTTADYGIVFRHAGIVTEQDASPLSHVAILCRELGVPFICGVQGARMDLIGHRVAMDGASGAIEILEDEADGAARPGPPSSPPKPTMSAVELLLRVLAEGRPGRRPAAEAERIIRRYARSLGSDSVPVVAGLGIAADELDRLERLGVALFGPDFSAASFMADATGGDGRLPLTPNAGPGLAAGGVRPR
ncbi:MAG: pyruvate, water dikinase, partial [Actinomycetota bacterium]|nr:pyruvate, water dikinase [Actinomycetota bacterium]